MSGPGGETIRWVEGGAGRLRVSDGGRGRPSVLFLHSLGGTSRQWEAQLRHLRRGRRTVAFDQRGHGASPAEPDVRCRLPDLVEDVATVVSEIGLEKPILVGHSLGAGVAAAYAASRPGKVAGLVLVDPIGEQRKAEAELRELIAELRRDYDATLTGYWKRLLDGSADGVENIVLSDLREAQPEAVIGSLEATLDFDPVEAFRRFDGPALLVRTPRNDFPISLQNVVEELPEVVVDGTSHWVQMDLPSDFNRILDEFIGRAEGS